MDYRVQVFFMIIVLVFLVFIVQLLKKNKINLKYTLLWLFATLILLIISIFPKIMYVLAKLVGVETPINIALILSGIFVVLILISITSIVSELNKKLRNLIQEFSLLSKELKEIKEKINKDEE